MPTTKQPRSKGRLQERDGRTNSTTEEWWRCCCWCFIFVSCGFLLLFFIVNIIMWRSEQNLTIFSISTWIKVLPFKGFYLFLSCKKKTNIHTHTQHTEFAKLVFILTEEISAHHLKSLLFSKLWSSPFLLFFLLTVLSVDSVVLKVPYYAITHTFFFNLDSRGAASHDYPKTL